ncbi:hypothetical protein [Agromyces sp. SYSU T00266]|uniref:hypothetical protein n=1 Tax=Agromyces zhanjiangensis TaxID=3158562 RepID=UPI00339251CA
MPETTIQPTDPTLSTLPGAAVLHRVRRLLVWALGTGVAYSLLGGAGRGYCPGGFSGDGGFIDADGRATDAAGQCVTLTLEPSGIVFLAIAVIVVMTVTRVLRYAGDEADAIRRVDRAVRVVVGVVAAWTIATHVSFFMIPVEDWDGVEPFQLPATFGTVDVSVTPLQR